MIGVKFTSARLASSVPLSGRCVQAHRYHSPLVSRHDLMGHACALLLTSSWLSELEPSGTMNVMRLYREVLILDVKVLVYSSYE